MNSKEVNNLVAKIIANSFRKHRLCLFPSCTEKSIASHLLQKKGILDAITEKNHLYTYFTNHQTNEAKFKLTGRNDAFTFQGYCQVHDGTLFKPIEVGNIDFSNPMNNLLFTFRALFNELRKKEIFNQGFKNVIESKALEGFVDKDQLAQFIRQNLLGERDLRHHLQTAHQDYLNNTTSFHFETVRFPKIPICISATISIETDFEMISHALVNPIGWASDHLPALTVNFFPLKNENIMLLAYPVKNSKNIRKFVQNNIIAMAQDGSLKKLSDLIIKYIETWACSPSFYNSIIKKQEAQIIKYSRLTAFHNTSQKIPINMFEEYTS